jgi:hypothetical protein
MRSPIKRELFTRLLGGC